MSTIEQFLSLPRIRAFQPLAPLRAGLARVRTTWKEWMRRERSRRELRELEDHQLSDVGIPRGVAQFEGNKPFWRE